MSHVQPHNIQRRKKKRLYRCGRKVGYLFAANAYSDMQRLIGRQGNDCRLQVYACGQCKGFHVGRAPLERRAN